MAKEKPLVILAGWLGCQQRSLRRYEQMFAKNGFQVLSKVASPTMVAESCFQAAPPPALRCHSKWPTNDFKAIIDRSSPMQEFAWDVLREVHSRNCPYFIFYAFSNGGCLVWEQVRRILRESIHDMQEEQCQVLESLRERTAGVVFDSCPSRQLAYIGIALAYCTWSERFEVMKTHGWDVAFFPPFLSEKKKTAGTLRSIAYYRGLKEDPWDIPQLYLYSKSDMLIPSDLVDELSCHRRNLFGSDRIFRRKWESSRHCAHMLDHPKEYETTLETFFEVCRPRDEPRAKL